MKASLTLQLILAAGLAPAQPQGGLSGAAESGRAVTFSEDVAPILFENCSLCHRPGGSGPFSLLSYRDASHRARQIAEVTASRFMPPWLPEKGYGRFQGERRLTASQIALLQAWAAQGAPEGDPGRTPAPPRFSDGWELGEPDLVVSAPEPYMLPAAGLDVFRNFVFPLPLQEVRYVEAIEIFPGNKRVVHHANVLPDTSGEGRRRDVSEPGPGFSGMDLYLESESFESQTHFLFWKPGSRVQREASGMAWRVDAETDLILNLHLQPSGRVEEIRPSIALYFTDQAPTRFPMLIQLENDRALDIPPGEKRFEVGDQVRLPVDVEVLGVYPHAHYVCRTMEAWAELPDGSRRWLIKIPGWDFNWQGVFRYQQPLYLPAGSLISMRYAYDNSAENPLNPFHPPRRVTAGNQSTDEMAHLWLQVLAGDREKRLALREGMLRHRLERYPDDAVGYANLGAVLQLQGRLEAAIAAYRQAVRLDPSDAVSLNNLGAALQTSGRLEQALPFLERAVQSNPDYVGARYNLGNVLTALDRPSEAVQHFLAVAEQRPEDAETQVKLGRLYSLLGDPPASIRHYRAALKQRPDQPEVLNDLGALLASQQQWQAARQRFEDSLRLRPGQFQAHANLGLLAAGMGNLPEAIRQFEKALQANPRHADTHNNLGIALAQSGRPADAVRHFQRALELSPDHPAAAENLRRAEAILQSREIP